MVHRSRILAGLVFLATIGLASPPDAAAQRAVPRGGGGHPSGGGGGRPGGGGGHPTGVAVPRTVPPNGYRPYYGSGHYGYGYGYGYGRYYYPYAYSGYYYPYYSGFAFGVGFGWGGAYWGAYGYPYDGYPSYGYPYYGNPYWYDNTGSARLQISPRGAQVYVDGQFAGLVDDFDGSFQRLHVEAGEHQVQVHSDGYRAYTQKVLFTRGTTVGLEGKLEPLRPGEPEDPRPVQRPAAPPEEYQRPAPPQRPEGAAGFGTLSIRTIPPDALILVDGEAWERPQGDSRFSIELANGPHHVEVRKEGFRAYVRTVDILGGRTFTLNVSLTD